MAGTLALPMGLSGLAAMPRASFAQTIESPIAPPDVTAKALYVWDETAGMPLYSRNADDHLAVGSIVKLMTALTVLHHVDDLTTIYTATTDDEVEPPYTEMNLVAGDQVEVGLLLYGMLIPSGNDAARCLARNVGIQLSGTDNARIATQAFMDEMNRYAAELGLDNSRFITPDGTDAPAAYSSAEDVCLMMRLALKSDKLRSIMKEPAALFYSSNNADNGKPREYSIANTNHFLNGMISPNPGIIAGKTGTEVSAGANIVVARQVGNNIVIITLVGSGHSYGDEQTGAGAYDYRYDDATAIISAMDTQFTWATPDADGILPGLSTEMLVWDVALQNPPAIPVPLNMPESTLGYQLQLESPGDNDSVGSLLLYYGATEVGSLPLYAAGA